MNSRCNSAAATGGHVLCSAVRCSPHSSEAHRMKMFSRHHGERVPGHSVVPRVGSNRGRCGDRTRDPCSAGRATTAGTAVPRRSATASHGRDCSRASAGTCRRRASSDAGDRSLFAGRDYAAGRRRAGRGDRATGRRGPRARERRGCLFQCLSQDALWLLRRRSG